MASTVWRGYLTFGLISIPIRLFRAARAERVPLRRVARISGTRSEQANAAISISPKQRIAPTAPVLSVPELVPVSHRAFHSESSKPIEPASVTKGFEVSPSRFVEVTKDDLKQIAPETSSEMAIQEFVAPAEIDPVYFETSYYVVPEEVGEKAYGLLFKALQSTKLVAVTQLAMHNRDHVVIVRPGRIGLVAHTMFYSSEVHADEEFRAGRVSVTAQELQLAEQLVQSLVTPFDPDRYKNQYRTNLEDLIAAKTIRMGIPQSQPVQPAAEVVDIASALRQSLAELKKPAGKSGPTPMAKKIRKGTV